MKPNNEYVMGYIKNKTLFKAVMFARNMMRDGTDPAIANSRAAKYYKVKVSDVAHHTGTVAGRISGFKKQLKKEREKEI